MDGLTVIKESSEANLMNDETLLKIPLPCATCNYVMKSLSDAQSHLSMFPDCRTLQFNCMLCPNLFKWPGTLVKHFHKQHQGPGDTTRVTQRRWYYCDVCQKPLLSKHALSLHRSKFHGLPCSSMSADGSPESTADSKRGRKQGTRVCRICKRTFVGSSDFYKHIDIFHNQSALVNEDDSAFNAH